MDDLKQDTLDTKGVPDEAVSAAGLAAPTGSAHCVRHGCCRMPLKYMKPGESHQTGNGFFTIKISGYYCPRCGAGYGGQPNQ